MTCRCPGHTATRDGRDCACTCGWSETAASGAQARLAVSEHVDAARATARRARRADRYAPSGGPVRPIVFQPPAPLAGQPDRRR
jgi:hypothetical protein